MLTIDLDVNDSKHVRWQDTIAEYISSTQLHYVCIHFV